MPSIYLDESGNLTKNNGGQFITASFSVGGPKRVINAFRRTQKNKFPKQLRAQAEVKFNNSTLDDNLRRRMLLALTEQDIRIFYTHLATANIPDEYMGKDRGKGSKVQESGQLYLEIVASTLELYLPLSSTEFHVYRDRRSTKGMTTQEFNDTLCTRLLPSLPAKALCQIEAVDSTTNALVQVADWICGALARYHEGKENGQEFYTILKPYIVEQKELFSELWDK